MSTATGTEAGGASARAAPRQNSEFWGRAGRYATKVCDEPFAGEMAYMMVSLYRTG